MVFDRKTQILPIYNTLPSGFIYITGIMKILPQLFYESPEIKKILVDGLSCAVYKRLEEPVWHKEGYVSTHAITLVLNGVLRVDNDNGLLAEVPAGKMIFLPKGLYMISDIIPENGFFEAIVFFFDKDVISQFINSLKIKDSRKSCISHLVLNYTENLKIFTQSLLKIYSDKGNLHRQLTAPKLFEFLHLVNAEQETDCFIGALSTLNNKERKGLKEFMNTNFSKPLSIEDYAYLTGRTLSTFRRDFKTQFGGVSPKQWLIDKRLEKAHYLLKTNNNMTISDVVMETGYENIPHFTKAFHKKYGLPPKQFLIKQRREVLV
jgi:AraC family transcriptional regulator, exoenzyme S synthesis regulatory protein ExsA